MQNRTPFPLVTFPIATLTLLLWVLTALAADGSGPSTNDVLRGKGIRVIPRPAQIEPGEGRFTLTPGTVILVRADTEGIGRYLAGTLAPATGFQLKLVMDTSEKGRAGSIELALSGDAGQLGDEGYELQVFTNHVRIQAARPAGVFYACQTLRQLFPVRIESRTKVEGADWTAPVVRIRDKPRFVWRGLMLDPARHFISTPGVLKCLDWMSFHKLNRLHLHLTDVDGWRLEIRKYPRLSRVGAWTDLGDGLKRGGFYTQGDIRKIVAYAAQRFISVWPKTRVFENGARG